MDDLISRQAVKELAHNQMREKYCGMALKKQRDFYIKLADSIIDLLPSAEPEIIRCGQCKYAEVADKEDDQDGYTCQFHRGSIWFSGSYCSWAERRTDEQTD